MGTFVIFVQHLYAMQHNFMLYFIEPYIKKTKKTSENIIGLICQITLNRKHIKCTEYDCILTCAMQIKQK